ncbi:4308_t:CDS:2 [Entrophospora sp. SA101]|nr:4308_t:CDS:2 [Entrophospora sp. SA101]
MSISSILNSISSDRIDKESSSNIISSKYLMEIDNLIRRKDGKIPFLDMAFNLIFKKRRKKPAIIQIDNLATSKNVHNDENCDRIDQTDNNIKYKAEDIFYEHPNLTITTVTTAATTTVIPLPTTPDMPNTIATSTSSQSGGKKSIFKCRVFGCEKC